MIPNIRAFVRNALILVALCIPSAFLSSNFCKFNIKVKQTLKNEGFHRNITYGIIFNTKNDERWLYDGCLVGLTQKLPAGVFANPDELSDLRRVKKLNAALKNPVNVELPTEASTSNNVYITAKILDGRVNLWLPVHARYHQAVAGGGSARNEIGPPRLFLACPDKRLDLCNLNDTPIVFLCNGSSREKCKWKQLSYTMLTGTLIWDVPVGNTDHYYVVAIGTAFVIIVGSLYLLKAIHDCKVGLKKKSS